MKQPGFYQDSIQPGPLSLDKDQARHLIHVLRLKKGQHIELFDGKGALAEALITNITPKTVTIEVTDIQTHTPRTNSRIIIAAAVAKARRFDQLITKCTELGADHIAAVTFQRSVKQPKNLSNTQRYLNLTIAAAKQCRRIFLPKITGPENLEQTLIHFESQYPQSQLFFGSLEPSARPPIELTSLHKDTIAFIGPEGGMTEEEENLLKDHNASPVRLTDTVLRTETAALAFAAILCTKRDNKNQHSEKLL